MLVAARAKGSKEVREIVTALLTRPEGTTRKEMAAALDWPSISVQRLAKQAGLRLRVEQPDGGLMRYYGYKPVFTIRERGDMDAEPPPAPPQAKAEEEEGDEGLLAYHATSNHLHVIGPQVKALPAPIVPISIEPWSDEQMKGSAFDVIIRPDQIRIVFNGDYLVNDRNKGLVTRTPRRKHK